MASKIELIQRWDSFLNKIESRYMDSLLQAKEACLAQLVETDYDYYTVYRSWQGMKAQIDGMISKIDETWSTKVRPQMIAIRGDDYFYEDESRKASQLTDGLHDKMQRFQILLEGKLSQEFYNHAITIANKSFSCSQCGASLTIKKDLFRAQYVSCNACNSVNTFEPETKFLQIGGNIIDNIVTLKCLPLLDEMENALENIRVLRKENQTENVWDTYKATYFKYWETFFKERIQLKSDAEDRIEEDMERKRNEYKEFENIQRHNKYGVG